MNKRHIPGFFDALARTPSFAFLCTMLMCGAAAGGLTGLYAAEGDSAFELTSLLRALPGQAGKSILCAVLWLVLALPAAFIRPAPLYLSGLACWRLRRAGEAVVIWRRAAPAVPGSVAALLAALTLLWECTQGTLPWAKSHAPFLLCMGFAGFDMEPRAFCGFTGNNGIFIAIFTFRYANI